MFVPTSNKEELQEVFDSKLNFIKRNSTKLLQVAFRSETFTERMQDAVQTSRE